jgi:hypothetical protein
MALNDTWDFVKRLMYGASSSDAINLSPEQVMTVKVGNRDVDMYYDSDTRQYLPIYAQRRVPQDRTRVVGYTAKGAPLLVTIQDKPDEQMTIPAAALNFPAESLTQRSLPPVRAYSGIHGDQKQRRKAERLYENDYYKKRYS